MFLLSPLNHIELHLKTYTFSLASKHFVVYQLVDRHVLVTSDMCKLYPLPCLSAHMQALCEVVRHTLALA